MNILEKSKIHSLEKAKPIFNIIFNYNNCKITSNSINSFQLSVKKLNDTNNKMRENIIGAIINNKVPNYYYKKFSEWASMKHNVNDYINRIVEHQNPDLIINTVECIHKGGRKNNYDFIIVVNEYHNFNIELKFNASNISETPQFVSLMKPSQYLSKSYEEYYYDNYIPQLSYLGEFQIPNKEEYLQQIHSTDPKCMKEFQKKYYYGCKNSSKYTGNDDDIQFYNKSKELSKDSISSFIDMADLNLNKLTEYLQESQKDKIYMLYKNNKFYAKIVDLNDYYLVSYEKHKEKSYYIATSITGNKIKILFRWKNGNGIAFPSLQIS
jgi:hypothetical protein